MLAAGESQQQRTYGGRLMLQPADLHRVFRNNAVNHRRTADLAYTLPQHPNASNAPLSPQSFLAPAVRPRSAPQRSASADRSGSMSESGCHGKQRKANELSEQAWSSSGVDQHSTSRAQEGARLSFVGLDELCCTIDGEAALAKTAGTGQAVSQSTASRALGSRGTRKVRGKRKSAVQAAAIASEPGLGTALAAVDRLLILLDHTQKADRCA